MTWAVSKEKLLRFDLEPLRFEEGEERTIALFRLLMEINQLHGFILDLPSFPRVSEIIYREELVRAVGGTTAIEGNALSLERISEVFEKADRSGKLGFLEIEVNNSRKVYEFILDFVHRRPEAQLTEELVRQMHTITTRDLPYPGNKPGAYRTTEVSFGIPRVPALLQTEAEVRGAMRGFVAWLNDPKRGDFHGFPLVKANLAHYYLSEIHPFVDGNGRTARALEALILYKSGGFNRYCFWSLANFFSTNRDEYLRHLRVVRQDGDITPFLEFSAGGYKQELRRIKEHALGKVKQLMFMDYVHYLHREKKRKPIKINDRIVNLLAILCKMGASPLADLAHDPAVRGLYASVTRQTWSRDWRKMGDLKLVRFFSDKAGAMSVEPNFGILDELSYR